jgi:hypothetical protein
LAALLVEQSPWARAPVRLPGLFAQLRVQWTPSSAQKPMQKKNVGSSRAALVRYAIFPCF